MWYRIAAQSVMVLHFAVLAYLAFGGFLAWKWPRTWFAHLLVASWGLVAILVPAICPLTHLENEFRRRAGEAGLEPGGFIDTYIEGVVYPEQYTVLIQWSVAGVVAISWVGAAVLLRRRRRIVVDSRGPAE